MIDPICFEEKWLTNIKVKLNPNIDITLLERMIYALELLGQLTKVNDKFIFKGGTALVLLLPEIKRLSIDIDVIGSFTEDQFSKVIDNSVFIRYKEDERESKKIPKTHFKFYYTSKLDDLERYILLDILDSDNPYSEVTSRKIKNPLFNTIEDLNVNLPSINDILGDKLTAFAPNTTGVPYGKGKSLEMIKQLYDINNLFNNFSDLIKVKSVYTLIANNESGYRDLKLNINDSLIDSIYTAYKLCRLDFKGSIEDEETAELRAGIRSISGFLLSDGFNFLAAKAAASKVALLSALLMFAETNPSDIHFDNSKLEELKNFQFPKKLQPLNSLKRTNIEAYFYWYKIVQMVDDLSWLKI
jgi:predicted nucleotidyltransferase component of viral defense system